MDSLKNSIFFSFLVPGTLRIYARTHRQTHTDTGRHRHRHTDTQTHTYWVTSHGYGYLRFRVALLQQLSGHVYLKVTKRIYIYTSINTYTHVCCVSGTGKRFSNRKETSCLPLLKAGFEAGKPETSNREQTQCPIINRLSYRESSKNLNSTARPSDEREFSLLGFTADWLSHLALAIYLFVVVALSLPPPGVEKSALSTFGPVVARRLIVMR